MKFTKEVIKMIKTFIINKVSHNPNTLTSITCSHFQITRPTVYKYINELVEDKIIERLGSNRSPNYQLVENVYNWKYENNQLEEDILWSKDMAPILKDIKSNVKEICQYGFTEMVNNVIDHSESESLTIQLSVDYLNLKIQVSDSGIGIFEKIKTTLGLEHPKQAILELAKGKFTSDPENHSGEGIFFTSRVFDTFLIFSHQLRFVGFGNDDGFLFDERSDLSGTTVHMEIKKDSAILLKEIFDEYADPDKDPSFHKTRIPVELMQHEGEFLLSRSQAKRLISRFDRFTEVILDFKGVTQIGQAFADEAFRVFTNKHPDVHLATINTSADVSNMIKRVQSTK
jgi:anti-sigma regulatory factor (Ser/Thr protein kinase)